MASTIGSAFRRAHPDVELPRTYPHLIDADSGKSDQIQADFDAGKLEIGVDAVNTLAYYAGSQYGGCSYRVVATATGTDDGGSYIDFTGFQLEAVFGGTVSVAQFGARCDTRRLATNVTAGSTTATSSGGFLASDVGKTIVIPDAGPGGATLVTPIASYTNSASVEVGIAATGTVAATRTWIGSDDTSAVQAAIDSVSSGGKVTTDGGVTVSASLAVTRDTVYDALVFDFERQPIVWAGPAAPMVEFDGAVSQQWQRGPVFDNMVLEGNSLATDGFRFTDCGNTYFNRVRAFYIAGAAFRLRNWAAWCENVTFEDIEVSYSDFVAVYEGRTATGGPSTSDSFARQHWGTVFGQELYQAWFQFADSAYIYDSSWGHVKGNCGGLTTPVFDVIPAARLEAIIHSIHVEQGAAGLPLFDFNGTNPPGNGPDVRRYNLRDDAVLVANGDLDGFRGLPRNTLIGGPTVPDGGTTADVFETQFLYVVNSTPTVLSELTGGYKGQLVHIRVNDPANTQIGGISTADNAIFTRGGPIQTVQGEQYTVVRGNDGVWRLVDGHEARRYSTESYAASFTPNIVANGLGQNVTLTGDLTVNAPAHSAAFLYPGKRFRLILTQDATGGHVVDFGAGLNVPSTFLTSGVAGSSTVIEFESDGSTWWPVTLQTGMVDGSTAVTGIDSATASTYTETITGDGTTTTFSVTHNLGSEDVSYSIRENSTGALAPALGPAVTATDANTISIEFDTAPAAGEVYTVKVRT